MEKDKTFKKETIEISREQWDDVQKQLKMLYEVADKGRIYNYESQVSAKKPLKVKLSKFRDGIIVGWRTVKDQAIYDPRTGKQVGEDQQYEVLIMLADNNITPFILEGYSAFSEARYSDRIECEVVGKKEDFEGNLTFDVKLLDGRIIPLNSRFVN